MLIGIAGPKRSGKDTLARALSKTLGLPVDSFAAPLRKFVAELLNCSVATLESCKEHPIKWLDGATPRGMMQTVGTEWGRDMVHPDLWVQSLLRRLPARGGIISDVRFENEAREIRLGGGIVIELSRAGTGSGDAHISERPLPRSLVSATLANDGTPDELLAKALAAMARLGLDRAALPETLYLADDLLAAECRLPPFVASPNFDRDRDRDRDSTGV